MRLYPERPPLRDYLTDEQMAQLAAVLVRLVVATHEQNARRTERGAAARTDATATKSAARG